MKTNSNFPFFFLIAFFYLGLSVAYSQSDKAPFDVKEFKLSGTGNFESEVSGASISIVGTNGNQVTVKCFLKKDGKYLAASDSEAREFLEDYTIDISQSGNKISVIAKQKVSGSWSWKNKPSLSFEVSAPLELNTSIRTSGGSVALERIAGTQKIQSSGGSIKIQDGEGEVYSQSSGGSFNLNGFQGNADVKTSGGSVKIYGLAGNLSAHTSGGGMTLENIQGAIDAHTSGGSIKANLNMVKDNMTFQSSGGSISVSVPTNAGFDVDLRGGSIQSSLQNFQGTTTKNQITGKVNGGGHSISMQTSGGSIRIGNGD